MTYEQAYREAAGEADRLARLITERKIALRAVAKIRKPRGEALTKRDPRANEEFVASGLIASDIELKDLQLRLDRATQQAVMHGLGAVMELFKGR